MAGTETKYTFLSMESRSVPPRALTIERMSAFGIVSTMTENDCADTVEVSPASISSVISTYRAAVFLTKDSFPLTRLRDQFQADQEDAASADVSAGVEWHFS